MTTIDRSTTTPAPPPRWAVVCAWAAALTPVPSAIWRVTGAFGPDHTWRGFLHGGRLGGRPVSAARATITAYCGAVLVMLLFGHAVWNHYVGHLQPFKPLISDGTVHPQPGAEITNLYIPLLLWGPLLIAVAANYDRRRTTAR